MNARARLAVVKVCREGERVVDSGGKEKVLIGLMCRYSLGARSCDLTRKRVASR